MNFESCGPFRLLREDCVQGREDGRWRREFWQNVDKKMEGLSKAIGCYAFGLETKSAIRPWYVGKTTNMNGFSAEVFTDHKLDHYRNILRPSDNKPSYRQGRPFILLFPLVTGTTWRLSKNRSGAISCIDWLETVLIGMALSVNPKIVNKSKTRFSREVYVNGVIGGQFPGPRSRAAQYAKKAFTGDPPTSRS